MNSANGTLRGNLKRYGDSGVNLKSLVRIAKLMGKVDPMDVVRQISEDLHYARILMRIEMSADDLFADYQDTHVSNSTQRADDIMSAEWRGYQDGKEGKTKEDCPYDDAEMASAWRKWLKNGAEQKAIEKPGATMASVPRGRKARQSRMAGTERTQDTPRRAVRKARTAGRPKQARKQRSDKGQKRGPRKVRHNGPEVVQFPASP